MFIIWIALYFIIGGVVSTIFNVVLDIDDVYYLAFTAILWPFGLITLVICALIAIIGYIPKRLGEAIKKIMKNKKEKIK